MFDVSHIGDFLFDHSAGLGFAPRRCTSCGHCPRIASSAFSAAGLECFDLNEHPSFISQNTQARWLAPTGRFVSRYFHMTIFRQRHDGRVAKAAQCKCAHPRSIRGRVSISRFFQNPLVAQLAEHRPEKPGVAGSNPALGSNFTEGTGKWCQTGLEILGRGDEPAAFNSSALRQFPRAGPSLVEHRSPKPTVVGSPPTLRAIFRKVNRAGAPGPFAKRIGRGRHRGCGSSPSPSAISMRARLLLVVGRQIVNLLIRNIVGSIPTARTNLKPPWWNGRHAGLRNRSSGGSSNLPGGTIILRAAVAELVDAAGLSPALRVRVRVPPAAPSRR